MISIYINTKGFSGHSWFSSSTIIVTCIDSVYDMYCVWVVLLLRESQNMLSLVSLNAMNCKCFKG